MLVNFTKILILLFVIFFSGMVLKHYFSEKNINTITQNRSNPESQNLEKVNDLPVLQNDTNDVIEFNTGYEKSDKQNYKRNFWELFK
tara:strand:+ start:224 stop:484 length:261 start_codon:yes stop_codon:yes gene_type:complete